MPLDMFSEIVTTPFMQRAILVGMCIGVVGPLIGSFLVHREMALIGEALAHTAFAGVAIGIVAGTQMDWGGSPLFVALAVVILAALGLQYLSTHTDAYGDVPLAILLTGGFALGIAVITWGVAFTAQIGQYLYGSILAVSWTSVYLMFALSVVVISIVLVTHKQLLMITFDREVARASGIRVAAYDTILIVMTAIVVVGAMQMLGAILVAAMLVVPVAAAMSLTASFYRSIWLSIGVGELMVLLGIFLSYVFDIATGAMIVLVGIGLYLVALAIGR